MNAMTWHGWIKGHTISESNAVRAIGNEKAYLPTYTSLATLGRGCNNCGGIHKPES